MKTAIVVCSAVLMASCHQQKPIPPLDVSRLDHTNPVLFSSAPCQAPTASDRPSAGDALDYKLMQPDGTLSGSITRRLVVDTVLDGEDRFTEYMVVEGMPPVRGDSAHQKFGFITTRTGDRVLAFQNLPDTFGKLEVGKPVEIPVQEIVGDQKTSGTATLTLTGCGTLNEHMGALQGEAVHIYRLILPYSATPGSQHFDAAVEFEYAVVDRLNWPAIIRSPGSNLVMTSLTKRGA